jgi:hypothetical protein
MRRFIPAPILHAALLVAGFPSAHAQDAPPPEESKPIAALRAIPANPQVTIHRAV